MDANIQIKQSFFDSSQNKVTKIILANGEELTSDTSLEDITISIANLKAGKIIKPSDGFIGIKSIKIKKINTNQQK